MIDQVPPLGYCMPADIPTSPSPPQELRTVRDRAAACAGARKAAERHLGDLEASVPRARMEAEAEQAKAHDIQQRLDELRAATEVRRL